MTDQPRKRHRKSTGNVVAKKTKRGTSYGIRYVAGGLRRYETVGNSADGVQKRDAQRRLHGVLELIRTGQWKPPADYRPATEGMPTFHEFASEWYAGRRLEGLRQRTLEH